MTSGPVHPATPSQGTWRRPLLLSGAALGILLVAAWAVALAWGNSAPGRAYIRERAEKALRARVGPVEVGEAGLDLLLRARLAPVTLLGKGEGGRLLQAERVVIRPRLVSLLSGRVEPAAVALRRVQVWPDRAGGAGLGPFDLFVEMRGDGGIAVRVALAGGGHLDVRATRVAPGLDFQVQGTLSLPDDLPEAVLKRIPVRPSTGRIAIQGSGGAGSDGARLDLDFQVRATDLSFEGERLGPAPIGPLAIGASGHLAWEETARRVRLRDGKVTLGESEEVAVAVQAEGTLRGDPRFSVSLHADAVPWRSLVEALPPELGPPPTAPRLTGNLSARASASGALPRRGEWDVQVDLDLDDLRRTARAGGPSWLSSGFEWTPIDPGPGERPRRILVGPGNPAFVPYAELPQALVRAVTASEDAGFFGHRGFDFQEIANAVADRSRVRGASTISQQLSKNLFLSPERTLARKVREALGTVALEASLSKGRLLEIYLNIAEWGPGVYGVGEAARLWFGKDARELTVREAAFLATVIPSPRRFHARLLRSGITPWWNARIDDVLTKMRIQNQLTDEQLAAALAEPLAPLGMAAPGVDVTRDDGGAGLPAAEPEDEVEPGAGRVYLSR